MFSVPKKKNVLQSFRKIIPKVTFEISDTTNNNKYLYPQKIIIPEQFDVIQKTTKFVITINSNDFSSSAIDKYSDDKNEENENKKNIF